MNWIDFSQTIEQRLDKLNLDENQIKIRGGKLNAHSLVRGVAGSGKSVLLRKRIDRIKNEHSEYKVLVLTYNRFMAGWVKDVISNSNSNISIECCTFHSWAWHALNYNYNFSESVFLEKINSCTKKYDAILIDEAQDFKDEWFLGLLKLLNPETNSLFIVYDNTQSVYGNPHRRKSDWSWTSLGIKIVGRTDILEVNYRNSPEIGLVSWDFFLPYINRAKVPISRDSAGAIIKPEFNKSRSSSVSVGLYQCYDDYKLIAQEVFHALSKYSKSSIAVMMHPKIKKNIQTEMSIALDKLGIENHAPQYSKDRNGNIITRPCVIIDSWNSLKGLEFDAVILVNIDYVNYFLNSDNEFEEFSGLYTAMTRARDHLVMLYNENNSLVEEIRTSIENTKKELTIKST